MLPAPCALHDPEFVLQAEQGAEHVGVEHRGIAFQRRRGHRPRGALRAGIVDGDIQPAEALDRLIDQATDIVLAAHVGENERGLRAEAAELGLERPAFGLATAGNDHGRALFDESDGGGPADSGQSSGDEHDGVGHGEISSNWAQATRSLPRGHGQKPVSRCCWKLFGPDWRF